MRRGAGSVPIEIGPRRGTDTPRRSRNHPRRSRGEEPGAAARRTKILLKELAIVIVGALVISFLLRTFVIQTFEIPSESMQQTLENGDRILVSKVVGEPHRGDIIVFEDFAHWIKKPPPDPIPPMRLLELVGILPDSSRNHLVKRIIGMPGDQVKCCDPQSRILVNGAALNESDYLYREAIGTVRPSDSQFEVIVPKDRYFVLGDHRNWSSDSRCHFALGNNAFVPKDKVVGPVVAIGTPLDRMRRFVTPEAFKAVPPAKGPAPEQASMSPPDLNC